MDTDAIEDILDPPDVATKRLWKRNAVGMPSHVAMSKAPDMGQANTRIPLPALATLNAIARRSGTSLSVWIRQAICMRLIAEGEDPKLIASINEVGKK